MDGAYMVNINNKSWEKVRFSDIEKILTQPDDETFFFEFKSDEESPAKLAKEISAFSNTFGGYIFLGVRDNKTVEGCTRWNEQRIHTTIHDSITPVPNFDVRKFRHKGKTILVIRVEEGAMPPYITNEGKIYERISSGSFPIKESSKLSQLYRKKTDNLLKVKEKIEFEKIVFNSNTPGNLCAYLDLGFAVTTSEKTNLQTHFYDMDLVPIANFLRELSGKFSISRMGNSYVLSFGHISAKDGAGHEVMMNAEINNYIEIMYDGSVKCRIVLTSSPDNPKVDIANILLLNNLYFELYSKFLGEKFHKIFTYAQKYERLTVVKQFVPYFSPESYEGWANASQFATRLLSHQNKYGNNLIIGSERVPTSDYSLIDRRWFDSHHTKYNLKNLLQALFFTNYFDLGYIDSIPNS